MGVIRCPRPDKNFDGRIFLERINNEHINGRRIIIDEEVYDEIGIGGW